MSGYISYCTLGISCSILTHISFLPKQNQNYRFLTFIKQTLIQCVWLSSVIHKSIVCSTCTIVHYEKPVFLQITKYPNLLWRTLYTILSYIKPTLEDSNDFKRLIVSKLFLYVFNLPDSKLQIFISGLLVNFQSCYIFVLVTAYGRSPVSGKYLKTFASL